MKALRLLFAASVLTITFCLPTFAGDISTTIASPPANTDVDVHTTSANAAEGSVTDAALALIESLLSLF